MKVLAEKVRIVKAQKELEKIKLDEQPKKEVVKVVNEDGVEVEDVEEDPELTENTPETRVKVRLTNHICVDDVYIDLFCMIAT